MKAIKLALVRSFKLFSLVSGGFILLLTIYLLISDKKIQDVIELLPLGVYSLNENVPLNEFSLTVRDYGNGEPTVIIEAGLHCSIHWYYDLQYSLSSETRVIAYNHAGIGESTPSPNPRTLPYYVEELRELMNYKELKPPFILVGHSLGGHIIRYYTYLYPEEVAGLVFIDHPHEDWFNYVRANWEEEEIKNYFDWWNPAINMQNYEGTSLVELAEFEANCDSIRGKKIPNDIPVLMFTGNSPLHYRKKNKIVQEMDKKAWAEMQNEIIVNNFDAKQIVDWDAGHSFHRDKPELVYQEIKRFIEKIKTTKKY